MLISTVPYFLPVGLIMGRSPRWITEQLAAAHAIVPDKTRDSLICYFSGAYRNTKFVVRKFSVCKEGDRHCFGTDKLSQAGLDKNLPYTKEAAQKLARECIDDIKSSVVALKAADKQH